MTTQGHFAGGEWRADSAHNQIVAVTNTGQKAANALLTLHYDNGEKSYEMQQSIQPGDQMWLNVASLIRNRIADRKGNVLPTDLSFGTYDVQDLSPGLGSLLLGNLALDGTFGFQAHPPDLPLCCVTIDPTWDPDYITFEALSGFGKTLPVNVNGYNSCTGTLENISLDFFSWWSGNTAVAQVTKQQVKSVGVGTTTGTAEGYVIEGQGSNCVETIVQESAPITVQPTVTITIQSSGTIPSANSARDAYSGETGTYNLGPILDGLDCFIGYQATGALNPSDYSGTVTLVRTKQGSDYDGVTGTTLLDSYPAGTDDSSEAVFEVTTPTNGVVYDLDAPFQLPSQNQIWRKRMNFFENAQLPDGTYVATEVPFYVRFSCKWGSGGSTFSTDVAGDNVLGTGTTKTSWNLQ